ncbi:MAG TPA: carboxymuconolactone decarboxylase family protein [Acidimicrobiia bacterium]|nr:carboxymuconolactone decarboxylase family protein [Acidimicrobiia bacterium]
MTSEPRVPGLGLDEMSEEVRALLLPTLAPVAAMEGHRAAEGEERKPLAVLTVLAHAPRLLGPFLAWASALALEGVLPRREHELLALRAAWNCRSRFEWGHHIVFAHAAGITDDEIIRLVAGPDADGWSELEAALLRAADQLHTASDVDDATWSVLAAHYDPAALVEIPMIVGQYTMLSMLTNACGVELEPGHQELPSPE